MHDELDEIIPAGRSRVMGAVKILGAVTILSEHALAVAGRCAISFEVSYA